MKLETIEKLHQTGIMDSILLEDIRRVAYQIDLKELHEKTVFITGATGLIGYQIAASIAYYNIKNSANIKLLLLVRTHEKVNNVFGNLKNMEGITFIYSDIVSLTELPFPIDFIVHCAGITASKSFITMPVETSLIALTGTKHILELARKYRIKSMVYLSSMEVYGYPSRGKIMSEQEIGALSPLSPRNSYPISKIMAESLCYSFMSEYGVSVKIVRLTQTFGPGIALDDARIFAEFAWCAINHKNIVLKSDGKTERSYLYTADAVQGILNILINGEPGCAYNLANKKTYCSIYDMAKLVTNLFPDIKVEKQLENTEELGYTKTLYMNLDTSAAEKLGWRPEVDLPEMYLRMIQSIQNRISKYNLSSSEQQG